MMRIVDGWLNEATIKKASDVDGPLMRPTLTVIHYTAGGSATGSVEWLTRKDPTYVSSHFVIERTGEIFQLVSTEEIAYHAGVSFWKGQEDCNNFSIGIELANWGQVKRVLPTDDFYATWSNVRLPKERVLPGSFSVGWEIFYLDQFISCLRLCRVLKESLGITDIVGHSDIAPGRKVDPGPAFPLSALRGLLQLG